MKDRFVLPTFRSECSDLLQGEDETGMRHLSLYIALHPIKCLSLELSVGATGLWLETFPVFFNAAIQHLGFFLILFNFILIIAFDEYVNGSNIRIIPMHSTMHKIIHVQLKHETQPFNCFQM